MTWEQTKKERVAAGLCALCGKNPISSRSKKLCDECRIKQNKYALDSAKRHWNKVQPRQYARVLELKENGKCSRCGKARAGSGSDWLCAECLAYDRQHNRQRAATHNEYLRSRYYERRAAGLCVRCGNPAEGKAQCQTCLDKQRKKSTPIGNRQKN